MNQTENWAHTFYGLFRTGQQKEALELKSKHIPESLFRYRSLANMFDIENIRQSKFFLSPPGDMNDPYESDFILDGNYMRMETYKNGDIFKTVNFSNYFSQRQIEDLRTSNEPNELFLKFLMEKFPDEQEKLPRISKVMEQLTDKLGDEMNQWFTEFIKDGIKFCSFSERNDSTLMWSHYANRHTGICVEYDFRDYPLKNSLFPVMYVDKMMNVTPLVLDKALNYLIPIFAITQKAQDWRYEHEWRLALTHGILEGNLINSKNPVRIYMGINISSENKKLVLQLGKEMSIEIIQMKKIPGSFKIVGN